MMAAARAHLALPHEERPRGGADLPRRADRGRDRTATRRRTATRCPPSLDVLVKGKFLRKAYKDPMSEGRQVAVHPAGRGDRRRRPGSRARRAAAPRPRPPRHAPLGAGRGRRAARSGVRSARSRAWPARAPRRACASSTAARSTTSGCSSPASLASSDASRECQLSAARPARRSRRFRRPRRETDACRRGQPRER